MDEIVTNISSDEQKRTINDSCKNLISYTISSHDIPGEGEKKIMENILDMTRTDIEGNYVIYSPDADVIIFNSLFTNSFLVFRKTALSFLLMMKAR